MIGSEHNESPEIPRLFNEDLSGQRQSENSETKSRPVGFGTASEDQTRDEGKPTVTKRRTGWGE